MLNGLQFGLMLFLLAAGLTLVFGIMDMINLAHGSLYMVGAYPRRAGGRSAPGSFLLGVAGAVAGTAVFGMAARDRRCCARSIARDHLSQVLATFAVILIANDGVKMIWSAADLPLSAPAALPARSSCCRAALSRPTGC